MKFFENFDSLKYVLWFLQMCPIFVGSVHTFGRSADDMIIIVKKCLFPIDAFMVRFDQKNLGQSPE